MGQVKDTVINNRLMVLSTPEYAYNIAYWGQKGQASVPYIDSLRVKVLILETKLSFQESINKNCFQAQEEYRLMVERNVETKNKLERDIVDIMRDRDKYKDRAKQRGLVIALGSLVFGGFTYLALSK
jgi:hypothetical protein